MKQVRQHSIQWKVVVSSVQFSLLHSNHVMVHEVHETYLHIYNNNYKVQGSSRQRVWRTDNIVDFHNKKTQLS